jgi:hypothetical protein
LKIEEFSNLANNDQIALKKMAGEIWEEFFLTTGGNFFCFDFEFVLKFH